MTLNVSEAIGFFGLPRLVFSPICIFRQCSPGEGNGKALSCYIGTGHTLKGFYLEWNLLSDNTKHFTMHRSISCWCHFLYCTNNIFIHKKKSTCLLKMHWIFQREQDVQQIKLSPQNLQDKKCLFFHTSVDVLVCAKRRHRN